MKPKTTTRIDLVCLALGLFVLFCANSQLAQAQQVQVTAATPATAAQGTINLNVKVTGKGFKNGAKAKWFITGTTDEGGVIVNLTTFVNSSEVTANITVSDTAVIANFDIQIANPDGRGGKGTELFAVTSSGQAKLADVGVNARFVYCTPAGSDAGSQAAYSTCIQQNRVRNDIERYYMNGVEGVSAVFNIISGSNDLTINLPTTTTRRVVIDLFDMITDALTYPATPAWQGTPQSTTWFFNVRQAYMAKAFCSGIYPCDMTSTMTSSGYISGDSATYYLQWKPDSIKPVNSQEITSRVNVHYDVINGVEVWTVTPLPNATSQRTVAGLVKEAKARGKVTNDPAGQYLVPFTLTASPQ